MIPSSCRSIVAALALVVCLAIAAPTLADAPRDQFAVAAAHYQQQRWALAAEEFQSFLRQFPLHPRAASARFFRAESLVQLRQLDEARREYRRYIEHYADGQFAQQARYRVGEMGYLLADAKQARTDLQAYLRKYPSDALNAQVLTYLGQLCLDEGDAATAVTYFRQALEDHPNSDLVSACRFGLGRALEKTGSTAEAIGYFQQLVDEQGDLQSDALFHLAACHYAETDYPRALQTLDRLAADFAQHRLVDKASLLRGWTLFQLQRYEEALAEIEPLANSTPTAAEAHYWLGLVQKKLARWPAAAETLSTAATTYPQCAWVAAMHFHAGDAWLQAGQLDQAEQQLDFALECEDRDWTGDALLGRARVALARTEYAQVEPLYDRYQSEYAAGPLAREFDRALATACINLEQLDRAIALLEKLIEAGAAQEHATEQRLLAQAYQRKGEHQRALDLLAGLSREEIDGGLLLTHGLALSGLQRYDEALEYLLRCAKSQPDSSAAARALAEASYCRLKLGDAAEAQAAYEQLSQQHRASNVLLPATQRLADLALSEGALDFAEQLYQHLADHPADELAEHGLFGLGRISFRRADFARSAETLADLIDRYPHSELLAEARLLRGAALEKSGDFDAAQSLYREVFAEQSETPLARRALLAAARLHRRASQIGEATALYQQLLERDDSIVGTDMVLYELAWILRDGDRQDEARQHFTRLHQEFPQSSYWADATYRLAEMARSDGGADAADRLLHQLIESPQGDALREFALYLQGQIAAERQRWEKVSSAMQRLLQEYPESRLARQAEFWLAEASYRQQDWDRAAERFEQLATRELAEQEWAALVALRRAQIRAQQEDWEAAYELAAKIASQHPNFRQQYEVDYLIGRCLANDARFEEARDHYRRTTRSTIGSKTETAAMAQWMIGESHFHQKDYRAAIQEYLRVEILYAYPTWQAAALLQAGKCHELLDEPEQAVEMYSQLLKRYPETQFADEAARRLSLAQAPRSADRK